MREAREKDEAVSQSESAASAGLSRCADPDTYCVFSKIFKILEGSQERRFENPGMMFDTCTPRGRPTIFQTRRHSRLRTSNGAELIDYVVLREQKFSALKLSIYAKNCIFHRPYLIIFRCFNLFLLFLATFFALGH